MEFYFRRLDLFSIFKDKRTRRLENLIELCSSANDSTQLDLANRMSSASAEFINPFEGVKSFSELKFALRPDQAILMAEKAVRLQAKMRNSKICNNIDEMVFHFIEASLSHRGGATWVKDKHAILIDELIATSEGIFDNK